MGQALYRPFLMVDAAVFWPEMSDPPFHLVGVFDPFWQAVVDNDVLVAMHASDSGYSRYQADWTGPQEMLPFRPDPFRTLTMGKRPIEDAMAAMICHGATM